MPEGFYNIEEAAGRLGVSQDELLRRVSSAGIRKFQDQGQLVFKVEDIERMAGGGKGPTPGDSIFQSSSSGLFDVDDLMAELGSPKQVVPPTVGSGLKDEPTELSPRDVDAVTPRLTPTGLVDEATEVSRRELETSSSANMNFSPTASGSFGLQDERTENSALVSQTTSQGGVETSAEGAAVATASETRRPSTSSPAIRSVRTDSGAVMSDSGLFNVNELVQEAEIINRASSQIPDDSTVIENPGSSNTSRSKSAGAVMSDSGLFDLQSVVGAAERSAERRAVTDTGSLSGSRDSNSGAITGPIDVSPTNAQGAVMSDSGLFNAQGTIEQMAAPPPRVSTGDTNISASPMSTTPMNTGPGGLVDTPTGGLLDEPTVSSGRPSSGAVMSDSGLFDVRDLVASPSSDQVQAIDSPTQLAPGAPVTPTSYSRPARFGSKGSGQSDSGLFSAEDVMKAVKEAEASDEAMARFTAGTTPSGGILIDPNEFNAAAAPANSATMGLGTTYESSMAPAMNNPSIDPRQGSGAGLKSPKPAQEGTSLSDDLFGGPTSASGSGAPAYPGYSSQPEAPATRPRQLTNSAIFGAMPVPASNQTEILDAQPPRLSATSGIFGTQARASATNATEILDAQPSFEAPPMASPTPSAPRGQPPRPAAPPAPTMRPPTAVPTLSSSVAGGSIGPSESSAGFVSGDDLFAADDINAGLAPQQGSAAMAPTSGALSPASGAMAPSGLTGSASGYPAPAGRGAPMGYASNPSVTMPTGTMPMQIAEESDPSEPAFSFILLVGVGLLTFGGFIQALTVAGLNLKFTAAYASNAIIPMIVTAVLVLIGIVLSFVIGRR